MLNTTVYSWRFFWRTVALVAILCWLFTISGPNGSTAASALFGGLAFVAMSFAVFLQSRQLELQKQALKEQGDVLKQTAQANTRSAALSEKNLRAQFLIFWLEMNKERYLKIRDIKQTISDKHKPMNILGNMLEYAEAVTGTRLVPRAAREYPKAPHCVDINPGVHQEDARIPVYEELQKFLDQYGGWITTYEDNLKELEEITKIRGDVTIPTHH